jgi:hypothetical protein
MAAIASNSTGSGHPDRLNAHASGSPNSVPKVPGMTGTIPMPNPVARMRTVRSQKL